MLKTIAEWQQDRKFPDDSVCIVDFCGYIQPGHFDYTVSADWSPSYEQVIFTGHWWGIPPMPAKTEPTQEDCEKWAKEHADYQQKFWDANERAERSAGVVQQEA